MLDSTASLKALPVQLNICSDGRRIVIAKMTEANKLVMRVRSMPLDAFDFGQTRLAMDATVEADVILVPANLEVLGRLEQLVTGPRYIRAMHETPDQLRSAFLNHLGREGVHDQRNIFRAGKTLPPSMARILARLGEDGYAILGGQAVFAQARAASRVAAATYLAFRQWPQRYKLRDNLAQELLGLNLVSQAFQVLENFAAMFAALKAASDGDFSMFAKAYLSFGHSERSVQAASVLQTLDELSGKDAHSTIGKIFHLPLSPPLFERSGLADCGIDDASLVKCARFTRDVMVTSFQVLARIMLVKEAGTGRPVKTAAARVYGAIKHGFAVSIPYLDPERIAVAYDTELFQSDETFESYVKASDTLGSLVYIDDDGRMTTTPAPITTEDLKPLLRVVGRCTFWLREFIGYAQSLYGSVDGRFPYLINAITILGPEGRALLQKRLDELESVED